MVWELVAEKKTDPPYKPKQDGGITENFDSVFTGENPFSSGMSPSPRSEVTYGGFTYKDPALS